MPLRQHIYANYGLFLKRLILGVIALPINVVGATPLPDGLPAVEQQLIASKDTTRIRDEPLVGVGASSSSSASLPPEMTQRNDEIRTVQFMPRPDFPEGPLSSSIGRPALPFHPADPGSDLHPVFLPKRLVLKTSTDRWPSTVTRKASFNSPIAKRQLGGRSTKRWICRTENCAPYARHSQTTWLDLRASWSDPIF